MKAKLTAWLDKHHLNLLDMAVGGLLALWFFFAVIMPPAPAPVAAPVVVKGLPNGYRADTGVVFVLMQAPLQSSSVADIERAHAAIAAAFPNQRVCVIAVDEQSPNFDSDGGMWLYVLGIFCEPAAATGKEKASR